jgi:pilus assembly protein CpaE
MAGATIITVMSPKGGAGKTTIATHLAVALALRHPDDVVIVDLDVAFGDVANALLVDSRTDLRDVAASARRGHDVLDGLQRHESSLRVVPAPEDAIANPATLLGDATTTIAALADRFSFVILDTGAGLDEVTLAAITASTDLVLVAAMDVLAVLALRKALVLLDSLEGADRRRHVVVNRAEANAGIVGDDVEAAIGAPIDARIPADQRVVRATNEGRPLTDGAMAAAIDALLRRIDGDHVPAHISFWRRRMGGVHR